VVKVEKNLKKRKLLLILIGALAFQQCCMSMRNLAVRKVVIGFILGQGMLLGI